MFTSTCWLQALALDPPVCKPPDWRQACCWQLGCCAAFSGIHGVTGWMALVVLVPRPQQELPAFPTGWGEGCSFATSACLAIVLCEMVQVELVLRPRHRRSPILRLLWSVCAFW